MRGPFQTAAQRDPVGHQRGTAGDRHRSGRPGRDRVAAERFDDGASGQPHQPDDDEGSHARIDSRRPAKSASPPSRGNARQECPPPRCSQDACRQTGRPLSDRHCPVRSRPRNCRGRSSTQRLHLAWQVHRRFRPLPLPAPPRPGTPATGGRAWDASVCAGPWLRSGGCVRG